MGQGGDIGWTVSKVVAIGSLVTLAACGKTLDTTKIADSIRDDIIQQGGLSLKEVVCPQKMKPEAGQTFDCVGVLEDDGVFAIPTTQQDDQGTVRWTVPSVKGLLNVTDFQNTVQQALRKEVGQATIDCGKSVYRVAKPGETFECKVLARGGKLTEKASNKLAEPEQTNPGNRSKTGQEPKQSAAKNQPGTILVTIDPIGNANWQRVFSGAKMKASPSPAGSPTSSPSVSAGSDVSTAAPVTPKPTTNNIPDPNRSGDDEVLVD